MVQYTEEELKLIDIPLEKITKEQQAKLSEMLLSANGRGQLMLYLERTKDALHKITQHKDKLGILDREDELILMYLTLSHATAGCDYNANVL